MFDFHDVLDLLDIHFEFFGNLFVGWFAVELLGQATLSTKQLVDRLDHVHWDTDGTRLVSDSTRDCLTDPPGRVGGEFETFVWVKLLDSTQQSGVAFLDQVQQVETTSDVALGDGYDEAHVCFSHLVLGAQVACDDALGEFELFVSL